MVVVDLRLAGSCASDEGVTRDEDEGAGAEKRARRGDFLVFSSFLALDSSLFEEEEVVSEGVTIAKPRGAAPRILVRVDDLEERLSSTTGEISDATCSWWLSAIISLAVFLGVPGTLLVDFAVSAMVAPLGVTLDRRATLDRLVLGGMVSGDGLCNQ